MFTKPLEETTTIGDEGVQTNTEHGTKDFEQYVHCSLDYT